MSHVAVLWTQAAASRFREIEMAAPTLGVQVLSLELASPDDLDKLLTVATARRADGLIALGLGGTLGPLVPQIVEFARAARLPTVSSDRTFAVSGGLVAYGPNRADQYRRAATYVDKILKGAKPSDLPVEQPTKFDFVINLKTAKELGLTIPPSILQQATEIIQ